MDRIQIKPSTMKEQQRFPLHPTNIDEKMKTVSISRVLQRKDAYR